MTTLYSVLNSGIAAGTMPGTAPSSSQLSQTLARASASVGAGSPTASDTQSWYEAMARAWGSALNSQAQVITDLSNQVGNAGQDQPSTITQLTAESMRFSYLATNASTSTTSVGEGLETLGRKNG